MFLPWLSLVVLNIFDVWTTYEILRLNGREGNPLARWMIENDLLVEVKVLALTLLAVGCIWAVVSKHPKNVIIPIMWTVTTGYVFVVVWNFRVLASL